MLSLNININLTTDSLGKSKFGEEIFLKDIWPTNKEINEKLGLCLTPEMFKERYKEILKEMIIGYQLIIQRNHLIGMILALT